MSEKKTSKEIYNQVKQDQGTHHIFSDTDQGQLADIIKQLGKGEDQANKGLEQELQKQSSVNQANKSTGRKDSAILSATDEEIEDLFKRLSTFDLEKIAEQQGLYNIYLKKLHQYKKLPNFRKIMKKEKYFMMIIDHLDHMSKNIIREQKQMEENHITVGI